MGTILDDNNLSMTSSQSRIGTLGVDVGEGLELMMPCSCFSASSLYRWHVMNRSAASIYIKEVRKPFPQDKDAICPQL